MIPLSYKKTKPVSEGGTAQIVSPLAAIALGVPWGTLVFVTELEREFAKAIVVVGENIRRVNITQLTGIENDEDIFTTKSEWDNTAECISIARYAATCSAIEALE